MRTSVAVILASLLLVASGCGRNSTTVLDIDSDNHAITIKRGTVHTIVLESNPSTGYTWQAEYDPEMLELRSDQFKPGATDRVGAPGQHLFQFAARNKGTTTVAFTYARPWEAAPIKTVTVTVTVR